MHVLVLGSGGREHAIVRALSKSSRATKISCAPGNPGIAQEATIYNVDITNPQLVAALAHEVGANLVVIGPEGPLAAGVSDALRHEDFLVFGPSRAAAQLESSKIFAKKFMARTHLPTARFAICKTVDEVLNAAKEGFKPPYVLKADGLAAGKGVHICENLEDLKKSAFDFLEARTLGDAGKEVLLEEFLPGEELSVLVLVSGESYSILPFARDYKRLKTGDEGPNTGGMGCYAPVKQPEALRNQIENLIVEPAVRSLSAEGLEFRGVLYFGLMLVDGSPHILEFNTRFGDPEAQVLLPLLEEDWTEIFWTVAAGYEIPELKFKDEFQVCVVGAAPGYPERPLKNVMIEGLSQKNDFVLQAGTDRSAGHIVTSGGRVLNFLGSNKDLNSARKSAYSNLENFKFDGMQFRTDIAEL